ncbi:MAG: DUF4358 domain-containing protein [Oscillospiraceae bacterium]|nr:DUF4358 domain-containing protein [Oscillospiraceae bacterium]
MINQKNRGEEKIKAKLLSVIIFILLFSLFIYLYSCEKKEPENQPDPKDIARKIIDDISIGDIDIVTEIDPELYTENKNEPIDVSKIEKYALLKSEDLRTEISIFKLYDKTNSEYIKKICRTRIENIRKIREPNSENNNAEVRSYGNYVYYVSHSQKDKVFEVIENMLKNKNRE